MDAILKSFPKLQLSEHVRAAPQPVSPRPTREEAEAAVKTLIAFAGDDPAREGLRDTPSRVVGLSKLARLIDVYARRLQTQEHMTSQVATAIDEILKPRGVAVMLEAEHLCMSMRGVQKPGVSTVTTQFTGSFREPTEQVRFITLVRGPAT